MSSQEQLEKDRLDIAEEIYRKSARYHSDAIQEIFGESDFQKDGEKLSRKIYFSESGAAGETGDFEVEFEPESFRVAVIWGRLDPTPAGEYLASWRRGEGVMPAEIRIALRDRVAEENARWDRTSSQRRSVENDLAYSTASAGGDVFVAAIKASTEVFNRVKAVEGTVLDDKEAEIAAVNRVFWMEFLPKDTTTPVSMSDVERAKKHALEMFCLEGIPAEFHLPQPDIQPDMGPDLENF